LTAGGPTSRHEGFHRDLTWRRKQKTREGFQGRKGNIFSSPLSEEKQKKEDENRKEREAARRTWKGGRGDYCHAVTSITLFRLGLNVASG